jgi:hypothetical protein
MKRNLLLWQLAGLTFTAVFGTLFHFLYAWTKIFAFAPFCAVNESTWEHMKILFFPMLFFALLQNAFVGKTEPRFWCVKLVGILLGTTLIPILFYTYNGAFGPSPDWLNVLFFFLSAGIAYAVEYALFKLEHPCALPKPIALILLLLASLLFVLFTFIPPQLPLFLDPVTGTYGLA